MSPDTAKEIWTPPPPPTTKVIPICRLFRRHNKTKLSLAPDHSPEDRLTVIYDNKNLGQNLKDIVEDTEK